MPAESTAKSGEQQVEGAPSGASAEPDNIVLHLYTLAKFRDALTGFGNIYPPFLEQIVLCPTESIKRTLKPRRERVCRFCGLGADKTKFNKDAHAIPELLGNKHLLSDSECDACNEWKTIWRTF
jgi:hypothetical protein